MTLIDLTVHEAHDLIEGEPVPGRADLRRVRELTAFLRATAEAEPAPPMRDDLVRLLDLGGPTSTDPGPVDGLPTGVGCRSG